jgi:DNA polymerase-3 subunit delta
VIDSARTRSLFAERRAVVVRGADALKGEGEEVGRYLDDPTPGVELILMVAKPDRRRVVWKRVLEKARVVPAEPLKGRALGAFVSERLKRRKVLLDAEGVQELIERVGQDLRRLMGEVEKLEAFGQGRALTADDVAAVLGRGMARPLYVLSDAIAARDAARALELTESLLDDREEPVRIVGVLHRALRQVRAAKALREARASREEMLSRLKLPPNMAFKLQSLGDAARKWSDADLRTAFAALGRADQGIKSGADPRVALAAAIGEGCVSVALPRRPRRVPPRR